MKEKMFSKLFICELLLCKLSANVSKNEKVYNVVIEVIVYKKRVRKYTFDFLFHKWHQKDPNRQIHYNTQSQDYCQFSPPWNAFKSKS